MKICTNCKEETFDTLTKYCIYCGHALESVKPRYICSNSECEYSKIGYKADFVKFYSICASPVIKIPDRLSDAM